MTARELDYLLLFTATLTAIGVARRDREHLPIAVLLAFVLVTNLARAALAPLVIADPPNAFYLLAAALYIAQPFALWGAASTLLASRSWWESVPAYVATVAYLIWARAAFTEERLRLTYLAVELTALLVCVALLARAAAGMWRRRETPGLRHLALALIVGVELSLLATGPWRHGLWTRWDLAQWGQVVLYGVLTVLQGGALLVDRARTLR